MFFDKDSHGVGRHAPRMPRFFLTLVVAFLATLFISWILFAGFARLTAAAAVGWLPGVGVIPRKDLFDLVRSTVTAAGLFAGVFAVVYSYRKQRVEEAAGRRADTDGLFKRYQDGAAQLGHDSAAVRLAGVYALAKLADDDGTQRQTIVEVLCAYLRMPYDPEAARAGEREVRHTIIRVIADHLSEVDSPIGWCGLDLDLTGATFDGGSFAGSHFTAGLVSFDGAEFVDGHTQFDRAHFAGATVSFGDGDTAGAVFSGGNVSFTSAEFSAGYVTMIFAQFTGAQVSFGNATFTSDAVLSFSAAEFDGSWISFGGPVWAGAVVRDGRIVFAAAKLRSGLISFDGIELSGGEISFDSADFLGATVAFGDAQLSGGKVGFADAKLTAGNVLLEDAVVADGVIQPWPLPPFPARRRIPAPSWLRKGRRRLKRG